jgi:outer membrane receptor protein involved in Fe transport
MKALLLAHAAGLALISGMVSAPATAFAQQSATQVDQIVVTARKREETDISVPVSMTSLSAKQIERQAVLTMNDVALRDPSLTVTNSSNVSGGAIFLRGIGTKSGVSGTLEQSVTFDVDGAPLSRGNVVRIGEYDLNEIQILKGPQALFFGKNSPAGVIAFQSKDPTREFESTAKLSYEPYADSRFTELAVSGPLTDTLRARLFVHAGATDGEKENLSALALPANAILPGAVIANPHDHALRNQDGFVRVTVVYEPNDRFKARLMGSFDALYGDGTQVVPELGYCPQGKAQTLLVAAFLESSNPFAPNFANPNTVPLSNALKVDDCRLNGTISAGGIPASQITAPKVVSHNAASTAHSETTIDVAELTYKLTPEINLTSVTSFARISAHDEDNFTWGPAGVALLANNNLGVQSQFTQELRATTKFSWPINFMVGGFFEDAYYNGYNQNSAIPPYTYIFYHIPNKVYSGFVQAIWDVTPQVEFAAGVRQTQEKKQLIMTRLGVRQPSANSSATFDNTSPEATLTWRPSSDLTAYAAYKTGFKSGGYAETQNAPNQAALPTNPLLNFLFEPEKAKGFEMGVKAALFNRTLRVDTTLYDYDYSNLQVTNYIVGGTGIPAQTVLNAASARQVGVEVVAAYNPPQLQGLRLTAMGNYNDAHFMRFVAPCFTGQAIAEGCSLNFNGTQFLSQDLSGTRLSTAPLWVGALGFSYSRPLGRMRLEVGADADFKSAYNASQDNSPGGFQKSATIFSGQIRLISDDESWEVGVYGKNLGDVYRAQNMFPVPLTGSSALTGTTRGGVAGRADLAAATNPGRAVFFQVLVRPGALFKK